MNDYQIKKFIIGIAIVILLVKILKKYLKQPRPNEIPDKTYGMPSTRAATLFFIITYLILNNKLKNNTKIILFLTVLFCCSLKYFMKEHSILQLTMGSILGVIMGYLIFII